MDSDSKSNNYENPFSDSVDNDLPIDIESDEQFIGDELEAFFDKEEKMYVSSSSVNKSDQGEKSSAMASGITLRSFMVESGDSDLINQKLTMSQYLAYKSEPLGQLGSSSSFRERPYFSFQESNASVSDKSEPGISDFNPDFSQEPSWLKKKSLSSLSSSENLDIPSQSPDSSEHWLLGKKKSQNESGVLSSVEKSLDCRQREEEKNVNQNIKEDNKSSTMANKQDSPIIIPNVSSAVEPGEELPSLYFKKPLENESQFVSDISRFDLKAEKSSSSHCHSYVAGHVETLSFGSSRAGSIAQQQASDVGTTSQNSSSPASTVRENNSDLFPRYDSVISEPQLSSTREITDDCIVDLGLSVKRVHFLSESERVEISHISLESEPKCLESLMEMPTTPNLCSTARSQLITSPESKRILLQQLDQEEEDDEKNEHTLPASQMNELKSVIEQIDQEWQHAGQEMTLNELSALTPEAWVAAFSNTSSLSTPLLMNKIKEHVLRLQGRGLSLGHPSQSSGIGGSGFETTEDSRINNGLEQLTNRNITSLPPPSQLPEMSTTSSAVIDLKTEAVSSVRKTDVASHSNTAIATSRRAPQVRHTLSALPSQTNEKVNHTQTSMSHWLRQTADSKTDVNENNVESLTAALKNTLSMDACKSISTKKKVQEIDPNQKPSLTPNVKCNKSEVYFGGVKVRQCQKQNLIVRNSCFKQRIELELRIKDSDSFYIVDTNQSLVSRRVLQLDPRQELPIELAFQPQNIGPMNSKLNLYPRDSVKKVKYTVDLLGYGGSSLIKIHSDGPHNAILPKPNGKFWSCRFEVENGGNVAAFIYVKPVFDEDSSMISEQCIFIPPGSILAAGDVKSFQVFIHPMENRKLTSFKLQLFWGDDPLRQRWTKCIVNGFPFKQQNELNGMDWTRLIQLDNSTSSLKSAVVEEDMNLFYENVKIEYVSVVFQEKPQDSLFVTLAAEPATVLEASTTVSQSTYSERRLTAAPSSRPSGSGVSVAVSEVVFPSTRVGSLSSQKIPLQNWSTVNQEVRVKQIIGPFTLRQAQSTLPSGYYTSLPIQFQPTKSGLHAGNVLLDVGHQGETLSISLKGEAY